jgi:TonB family protein
MVMLALILTMHTLEDADPVHASRNTGPKRRGDAVLEWSGLLSTIVAPPLLATLCLALAAPPFGRAQDAASALLPTAKATPTPIAEKPSLEILAGTPDHQEPAPAREQTPSSRELATLAPAPEYTPSARELATPAAKAKTKTRVKTHPTPAAAPDASAEPPTADLMSMSSAKAAAVSAPLPVYPYQAKRVHITGSGVCVMTVDTASGKVTDATMEQSTGNAILDKTATNAFQHWRFKPGTVSKVRVPITYEE